MSLYHGNCPHAFDSDIDCMTCGKCVPCIDMVESGADGYYPVAFFPYYHLPDLMQWLEASCEV